MNNKKILAISLVTMALSVAMAVPAFAAYNGMHGGMMRGRMIPGVFGKVTAVNGTSITITGRTKPNDTATATTYTVDASNATVTKNGSSSSVSNIAVGDTLMVQGTVTGTNIVATTIRDGMPIMKPNANPIIQGNGQPVVAGAVTTISGNTLTITNKSNITYTVDATNAKIIIGGAMGTLSSISIGDNVVVQGTVQGTSITASSVIDQKRIPENSQTGNPESNQAPRGNMMG
ncbi:MAG: DUF5666 domain-containing protein, partial [Candidatus Paceibacterales bacterium]